MTPRGNRRVARHLLAAVFLYLLALLPRLVTISRPAPQGDELFWNERSSVLLQELLHGRISSFTSHLGHPAIPAALAMAAGKYGNSFLPASRRLDSFGAARVGNAVLSSFIAPASYLAFAWAAGVPVAFLLGLFMALDVQHVGISRIAHVDSSFSVFAVMCLACYLRAVLKRSPLFKLLAGIFWGLCLASKPTAMALIPAFMLFKAARAALFPRAADGAERALITWSDFWAVIAGHATLALVFTRFWHHNGPFLTQLGVRSALADAIYSTGLILRQHVVPSSCAAGALCLSTLWLLRSRAVLRRCLFHAAALVTILLVSLMLIPQVLENVIRYWLRLPGLAEYVHAQGGFEWAPVPGGFFGVFAIQLPTFSLLCFLCGLLFLGKNWHTASETPSGRDCLSSFLLAGSSLITWTGVLSISSKELVRYLLPVFPAFYLVAAYGLYETMRFIARRVRIPSPGASVLLSAILLVFAEGRALYKVHPDYLLFYNDIGGGVARATQRGYAMFYAGYSDALTFLQKRAEAEKQPVRVAVVGDIDVILDGYRRLYAPPDRRLMLLTTPFVQSADYVLVTNQLVPIFQTFYGFNMQGLLPLYTYSIEDVPFTSVYKTQPLDFREPVYLKLFGANREVGGTTIEDNSLGYGEQQLLYGHPKRHEAGKLFSGVTVRILPGTYAVSFTAGLLRGVPPPVVRDDEEVLRTEFGHDCVRSIQASELQSNELTKFSAICRFDQESSPELRGYWSGHVPVAVEGVEIVRLLE